MKLFPLELKYLFCVISIFFCFGCGPKIGHSGFLDNYDNLKESEANGSMLSYISPDFEKGKYNKFMIADIVTRFGEKAKGNKIDQEKLNELTSFFKTEIIKTLSTDYKIVETPGDDVALIQIAVTEIVPGKLLSNIFPASVVVNTATGRNKGGAYLEMKIIDSRTKELLGQAIDNRKNRGYLKSFSKFGNARGVMTYWAGLLKETIDFYKN
ncbi:MAG: DUF3313 domain-containing protein [Psychroserpens sp.]|uniref:DUF3313 domain-containing protein n=1 Tax=Psychroserpens sp. TaxID=2020870 RepID=UPI003001BD12